MTLERNIEAHLVKRCKEWDILCEKFTSPQRRNVPDRILTCRRSIIFVELKATGKKPSEAQMRDHMRRIDAGACVVWTDSIEGVNVIIEHLAVHMPIPYLPVIDGGAPFKVRV
ncbi:hypothetical protein RGU70_13785 [Herbaspirillum sp. RTI4]|uniref:hypothetical protein n=1 Tax=Herbaspirillum sp. RTI4 TaxID=3048640 RepID=UPI002AB54F58|nr:hypothetical protein [Herbaspirillum sp. RTI4]MDY7579385.1 hypothetical protein [Herbaspirillum sp. RTI4]MEA9980299.1 hypothetical protein [Herbaspirillum sp. RTI4]